MNPSYDLVNRLWRLCALLRKDGVTYQQYVTELTYLLFLKMASEQKDESRIPERYRWSALKAASETEVLQRYKQALIDLGDPSKVNDRSVVAIFQNAATIVREPANLRKLIDAIDGLHWFSDERDAFGDAYEGLLQKMAEETKRGAGQYFTPRVLIDVMVELMKPQPGEIIQDPAAGTGGFLIAADAWMRDKTDGYFELSPKQQAFQLQSAIRGVENVPDTFRLLLMNLHLHQIDPDHLDLNDTLSPAGQKAALKGANLILTNPPFGPAGGPPTRDDLTITDRVSSYQLPFVEHVIRALAPGGRAAVIVPDNVLFDDGRGRLLRQRLMNWCDLHTILRLPTGIFYAQGVKTNVLFFTRSEDEAPPVDATEAVWIYDMRTGAPAYGKTNPIGDDDFADFVRAFGDDPLGRAERRDQGETGRFRRFEREALAARNDNLDITWLKAESADPEDGLTDPEDIAAAIEAHLTLALEEVRGVVEELDCEALALEGGRGVMPPPGWADTALGEICDRISDGSHNPPPATVAGRPMLSARNIADRRIIFDQFRFIDPEAFENEDRRTQIVPGTILLTIVGSLGRSAVVPPGMERFTVQRSIGVLHPSKAVDPYWLARRFDAQDSQRWFVDKARGTAQKGVYLKTLASFNLLLPPLSEQRRIVNRLDVVSSRLSRARTELGRLSQLGGSPDGLALIDRLEAAILARAFRGELVPQDPNDEPASVLLERIRARRAAEPKAKRGRRPKLTS